MLLFQESQFLDYCELTGLNGPFLTWHDFQYISVNPTMDAFECVTTKRDVREFSDKKVPNEVKLKILEAARLTGSGSNRQHWRFILVQTRESLKTLAQDSTSGAWVGHANFAVIVLTDPKLGFHRLDAGRAVQDMMVTAWNSGVVSCIYTGINEDAMRKDFGIPKELHISVIAGFGYPAHKVTGKRKNREPLAKLAFLEKFGKPLEPKELR